MIRYCIWCQKPINDKTDEYIILTTQTEINAGTKKGDMKWLHHPCARERNKQKGEKNMANEIDTMKEMESGAGLDLTEYEGQKTKIAKLDIIEVPSKFHKTGKAKVLKIEGEPVTQIKDKNGDTIDIRASEIFNVKEQDGQLGWSTNPKAGLHMFLQKYKKKHPKDLLGVNATMYIRKVTRADGTTGEFLGIM